MAFRHHHRHGRSIRSLGGIPDLLAKITNRPRCRTRECLHSAQTSVFAPNDRHSIATTCHPLRHPLLGISPREIVEDAHTMDAKPIPFRKSKRKQGDTLGRPTARIIPAGAVALVGETVIRTLPQAIQRTAA
jgi:hypothetical protein